MNLKHLFTRERIPGPVNGKEVGYDLGFKVSLENTFDTLQIVRQKEGL